jgi:hypothetical protein
MLEIKQATEYGWTQVRLVEQHDMSWNGEGCRSRGISNATVKEAVLREAT